MTREDRQILFAALGFLAVTLQRNGGKGSDADRAKAYAALIEEFCRAAFPEALDKADRQETFFVSP